MHCSECEKYYPFKNPDMGVCSLTEYFTQTAAEMDCPFLIHAQPHCGDCTHFQNDDACAWQRVEDTICGAFEHVAEENIRQNIFVLLKYGRYDKETIMKICEEVEASDIYQFIKIHMELEKEEES